MYVALYRKYRPRTFDDVISQEHITTTLKNQLIKGQHSHAYLFTGSRGTGKTTCAKILAKALNCLDLKDGNPCLKCENCIKIDNDFTDVTEIDAASNNGVNDVRMLKEEAVYTPISLKYKIYIIDEVHMLSKDAFNALLKIIEEPPEHVIFIFATTEVHKVIPTILSRCQRYEFRRIDISDSKKRLQYVTGQEEKTLSDDAAFLISKISEGGMRDALSLLDKCFSVTDNVDEETVRECAGLSGIEYLFKMSGCIRNGNAAELLKIMNDLIERSKDPARLCEELIEHYRCLMLMRSGAGADIIRVTSSEFENYKKECENYSLENIFEVIDLLGSALSNMSRVKDPSLLLQMTFIKLCDPRLDGSNEALLSRIERLERALKDITSGNITVTREKVIEEKPESTGTGLREKVIEEKPESTEKPEINIPPVKESEIQDEPQEDNYYPPPPPPEAPAMFIGETDNSGDYLNEGIPIPELFPPEPSGNFEAYEKTGSVEAPFSPAKSAESVGEDGFAPLIQWNEILGNLPVSIKFLIDDTTAAIKDNIIKVSGRELALQNIEGEYRNRITEEASRVLGRKVTVITSENDISKNKTENKKRAKLENFLEKARSYGVKIKEQ